MTKILDALRKGQGEIAELLPLVLEEQVQPPQPAASRGNTDDAAVRAVVGDAEAGRPIVPAPVLRKEARTGAVRELPIRLSGSAPLLPFDIIHLAAAEQYRIIRTRLIQHPKQPRMVLISSAGPGDGKSVTAVNVAGAMSLKTEANVLLLDTDFRRSTIHTQLGLPASPGLADVLCGTATLEEAMIRTRQFPNLYVIPAGERRPNPSELLDSKLWGSVCDELRSRFRYVLADSPPVASVADYELLQATCDGVVLVVRPDHSKRQACMKALEVIPKEKLIGVVMNCVTSWFLTRGDYNTLYYYGGGEGAEGRISGPK